MEEITLNQLKDCWMKNKLLNLDFKGMKDKFALAKKFNLEPEALFFADAVKDGKRHESWCAIIDTEDADNYYDIFYTFANLVMGLKKYITQTNCKQVILQFGYNIWEDNDCEEETGDRIILKVI